LPQLALSLYGGEANPPPAIVRLREILLDELPSAIGGAY